MCLNPRPINNDIVKGHYVPCGKCIECRLAYSREWQFRIAIEASFYEHNCFITLTYNNDNLPENSSLSIRDYQLFLKRLRKHISPLKCRYFACGEYGKKNARPHYHIIIFGYDFPDKRYFKVDNKGNALYRSAELESLWKKGFSSIVDVTFESSRYCAKYLQKIPENTEKLKPFTRMSLKPGIGAQILEKKPWLLDSQKLYINGQYIKLPRYFYNYAENIGYDGERLRADNAERFFSSPINYPNKEIIEKRKKIFSEMFGISLDKAVHFWYN